MKISKNMLGVIGSVALGIFLLVFIMNKYSLKDAFSSFGNITPVLVISYLLVSVIIMAIFAFRWRYVLKTLGYNVSFLDTFSFRIIDYGISYITPSGKIGGEPIRAALLTRKGIPFKEGLSTVFADKTIELSVSLLFFIFGILTLAIGYAIPESLRILIFFVSAVLLFLIWRFYSKVLKGESVLGSLLKFFRLNKIKFFIRHQHVMDDFEKPIIKFYKEKRKAFFVALFLSILSLLFSLIEYKLLLMMFGIDASISVVFMVFSVVGFAFLVPVPMGLGSLEAFQVSLFSILGIGSAGGVGLAMISRARDFLWVFVSMIIAFYLGALKSIFKEAYNAKYNNPLMRATVFRGGKAEFIDITLKRHESKNKDNFIPVSSLKKMPVFISKKKR